MMQDLYASYPKVVDGRHLCFLGKSALWCHIRIHSGWQPGVAGFQALIPVSSLNPGKRDWMLGVAELKSCSGWALPTSSLYQAAE